ncbi:hypothetical protein MKX01_039254 [Papaver californicum]|nr:hypothetical protein MKX01_039254 [Papaver californicum]
MTVDGRQRNNNNLLWRRLDENLSLPPTIIPRDFTSSLYANGCIYWLRTCPEPLVVEFNVGSEKFRVISVPKYIIEEIRHPYVSKLIQIDGRLDVLALKTLINNKTSMKMCVLYGDVQHKKLTDISIATTSTSSAGTVSDFHWIEETIMIPPFKWKPEKSAYTILAVTDTNLLIIKSEQGVDPSFYLYDWRKKSFSKDVQIILENRKTPLHHKTPSFGSFVYKERGNISFPESFPKYFSGDPMVLIQTLYYWDGKR